MTQNKLRSPEGAKVSDVMQQGDELAFLIDGTANQVVSFLSPLSFNNYQFNYGIMGKRTCIWINNGPNEFPRLLILHN